MQKILSLGVVISLIIPAASFASNPKSIQLQSQSDFQKGHPRSISIGSYGELFLAPEFRQIGSSEIAFIWATAHDRNGNTFLGGGDPGTLFKVSKDGAVSSLTTFDEIQVYALAVDRSDNVYAGTSPEGKVYKVPAGGNGQPEVFFDPEELYIWALAFDTDGNLYVATGEKGNIYRVKPDGASELFYASEETHIRRLLLDRKGNLVAGTADGGIILRISAEGRVFVLYDSDMADVTSILEDAKGNLYAAVSGSQKVLPSAALRTAATAQQQEDGSENDDDDEDAIQLGKQRVVGAGIQVSQPRGSELYRISMDGTVSTVMKNRREEIFALALNERGNILVASGSQGRLYEVDEAGLQTLVHEVDEPQITGLTVDAQRRVIVATSNPGNVFLMERTYAMQGEYRSDVFDASVLSQWGAVSWEAEIEDGGQLAVYARSGNTESPDATWSDWSGPYTEMTGAAMKCPTARFLQLKVEMKSDGKTTPRLHNITFAYLQKNIAPNIAEVIVHPASDNGDQKNHGGGSSQSGKAGNSQSHGGKSQQEGYRSVSWNVRDDNGDELKFDVFYRGDGDAKWRKLAEDLTGNSHSWDSRLMPDGRYFVKVVGNDLPSNPEIYALSAERTSQPFVIDNGGPTVSDISIKKTSGQTTASFSVEDRFMRVVAMYYSLNAQDWQLVYPVDGISDSRAERFEITLQSLVEGTNTIVIKAEDELHNLGFGKKHFKK